MNIRNGKGGGADDEGPVPGLDDLRVPVTPRHDLWPAVERRLAKASARRESGDRRPGRRVAAPYLAAAAALVLALGLRLEQSGWKSPNAPLRSAADVQGPATVATAADSPAGARSPPAMRPHPETRALVRANLKIIASAEGDIRWAMRADPDAQYLRNLLASARQQKDALHVVLADAQ